MSTPPNPWSGLPERSDAAAEEGAHGSGSGSSGSVVRAGPTESAPGEPLNVSYVRRFARCPHCGLGVLFDGGGLCPSCRKAGDAPVTAEDAVRVAKNQADDRKRAEEDRKGGLRRHDSGGGRALIVAGVFAMLIGSGATVASAFSAKPGDRFSVFYGLILVGGGLVLRGLTGARR